MFLFIDASENTHSDSFTNRCPEALIQDSNKPIKILSPCHIFHHYKIYWQFIFNADFLFDGHMNTVFTDKNKYTIDTQQSRKKIRKDLG